MSTQAGGAAASPVSPRDPKRTPGTRPPRPGDIRKVGTRGTRIPLWLDDHPALITHEGPGHSNVAAARTRSKRDLCRAAPSTIRLAEDEQLLRPVVAPSRKLRSPPIELGARVRNIDRRVTYSRQQRLEDPRGHEVGTCKVLDALEDELGACLLFETAFVEI